MSSFQDDVQFATDLTKGNLAEVVFERLAVHSGWFVRYTGDQYSKVISPETKKVVGGTGTPDFKISKTANMAMVLAVEVKYQHQFDRSKSVHKKGTKEDIRVVLSPGGYAVYPQKMAKKLGIEAQDWAFAQKFLERVRND